MRSVITFFIVFASSTFLLSQQVSKRSPLINEVNKIVSFTNAKLENPSDERSFNVQPDSIVISYNEVGGHSVTADYGLTYSHNKISRLDFRPDITMALKYKIYFYYDTFGSLFRANWFEIVGGSEVAATTVHYKYNSFEELISYIEYDKNNTITYGDSIEYTYNGSNINSFKFLNYQGVQYGWEPSDYIYNMKYNGADLTGYEKSEYYRFEDQITEIRSKYENATFYQNDESGIYKSIIEYSVLESDAIKENILSATNAATDAIPYPLSFDKYYYDYDLAMYVGQQKSVANQSGNVLTINLYGDLNATNLLSTDIFTFNGSGQLTNNITTFNNSEQIYVYTYNEHGRLASYSENLNGVLNSSAQYDYIVDTDENLKEYVKEEFNVLFGTFRDRYKFFYDEIILSNKEDLTAQLSVFPNPVERTFSIELPVSFNEICYTIIDAQGRVVEKNQLAGQLKNIDVSHLNPGVYMVNIKSGTSNFVARMIKL